MVKQKNKNCPWQGCFLSDLYNNKGNMIKNRIYMRRTRVVKAHFWPKNLAKSENWLISIILYFIALNNVYKKKIQQNV